jgi:hypothetical protein
LTDVIQSPAPPSTPPPATQTIDAPLHEVAFYDEQNERLAAESDPDSKALKALESMPAEDAAKEATKIQRRRRERAGVADPIVERKYAEPLKLDRDDEDATWEGTNTLRQASKDLSFSRLMDRGSALLNAGLSTQDALAVVNAELAQGKPSEQPFTKIGLTREDGSLVNELADHGPLLGLDENVAFKSPKDAARFVGRFRDEVARQQEALLADLEQREVREQQQAEQAAQEVKRADEAKAAEDKRAQERQQAEATRKQLEQQQAALAWEKTATAEERKLVDVYNSWEQWAAKIPELVSYEALQRTQQTNPARYAEIMKHAQRGKQIQTRAVARSRELYEVRLSRAQQAAAQYQAQATAAREQFNKAEDAKFNEALKRELPAFANGKAKAVLREAAREELRALGLTDEQISYEYDWGSLRSAAGQMLLAKAAVGRLAKNARVEMAEGRAPVPPVLKPGVSRPRGAGDIENVRALERQLASSKGNKSLQIARRLTQARRAAGLV